MAYMVSKKDLKFKQNRIVWDNKIVGIDPSVHSELWWLEGAMQRNLYLAKQPDPAPIPSLDGFEMMFNDDATKKFKAEIDTPILDKRAEESFEFLEEIDAMNAATDFNRLIDRFSNLVQWCDSDEVVIDEDWSGGFDLYYIGNPLELTTDDLFTVFHTFVKSKAYDTIFEYLNIE